MVHCGTVFGPQLKQLQRLLNTQKKKTELKSPDYRATICVHWAKCISKIYRSLQLQVFTFENKVKCYLCFRWNWITFINLVLSCSECWQMGPKNKNAIPIPYRDDTWTKLLPLELHQLCNFMQYPFPAFPPKLFLNESVISLITFFTTRRNTFSR